MGRPHQPSRRAPDNLDRPGDWREEAACRTGPAEIFFPKDFRGARAVAAAGDAKAICMTCPVLGACLRHALTVPEEFGVFGGLDEDERKKLRARIQRRARKQAAREQKEAADAAAAAAS
jgi:WhiB family redox-sensing transcriptional regulator